jgi:cellulose biosynthesis protein BcsQ
MKSLAFFNNKGGVGKTTLLCNVAAYLAIVHKKKICVVDCDPQCNATQYMFSDSQIEKVYELLEEDTVQKIFQTLMQASGYSEVPKRVKAAPFGVSLIAGDPRLSLAEDFLAGDWSEIDKPRGLTTTLVFRDLLSKLDMYDYVFFDVSPSLGALNRAILLSCDAFLSPMSIDIFALKAFENIAEWIRKWDETWRYAMNSPSLDASLAVVKGAKNVHPARFIGYVTQQYVARKDRFGERRAVLSYENIINQIDQQVRSHFPESMRPQAPIEIGTIPNLYSLVPMSQTNRKPVFSLTADDGVVGAHFAKVKDARKIYGAVADEIMKRL